MSIDPPVRLRATHNTTASGIRFADEIGGIPNPSLAIHRTDQPFDTMGEISLVAPLPMVSPEAKDVEVYDADIYSVRTPERLYETTARTKALLRTLAEESLRLSGTGGWENGMVELEKGKEPEEVGDLLSRSLPGQSLYLKSKGIVLEPVMGAPRYQSPMFDTPEVQAVLQSLGRSWFEVNMEDPEYLAYSQAVRAAMLRQYGSALGQEDAQKIVERFFGDRILIPLSKTTFIGSDLNAMRQGQVLDLSATRARADALVAEHGGEEEAARWWEKEVRQTYGEPYFLNEKGRKKPFTLAALSEEMGRVANPRSREKAITFGAGAARAALAHKLERDEELSAYIPHLASHEEVEEAKAAQEEVRASLAEALVQFHEDYRPDHPAGAMWSTLDDMHRAVGFLGRKSQWSVADARRALARARFHQVRVPVISRFLDYARQIQETPTQYLEVKMRRPVSLSEFRGAIVPEETPKEVLLILASHGLDVQTYPKRDAQARQAAFFRLGGGDVTAMEGVGILFGSSEVQDQDVTEETGKRKRSPRQA